MLDKEEYLSLSFFKTVILCTLITCLELKISYKPDVRTRIMMNNAVFGKRISLVLRAAKKKKVLVIIFEAIFRVGSRMV
jgi:hypothetical protein